MPALRTDNSQKPITMAEWARSVPRSFAVGFSAFVGSWFGLRHYIHQIPVLSKLPGLDGTKLIHDDLHFLLDLKQIIRTWKHDDNDRDHTGTRTKTTGEVVDMIEETAHKYGLKDSAKFVRQWAMEHTDQLTENTDVSRAHLQGALREGSKTKPFLGLFLDALDGPEGPKGPTMWRTGKSLEKLEDNMEAIIKFQKTHDNKILRVYRLPLALTATVGALALVGRSSIMRDRRDQSLAERLDALESKTPEQAR